MLQYVWSYNSTSETIYYGTWNSMGLQKEALDGIEFYILKLLVQVWFFLLVLVNKYMHPYKL